jgi:anaerobic ribonucleoside-triphosphate reductase activating protein
MNYLGIDKSSISNGPGVRVVLWVAGCTCRCEKCQNPESWNFNAGMLFDDDAKQKLFDALNKPYIRGISISGGHPLENKNVEDVYLLLKEIKEKFPTKDVWIYTGYTWEQIFPTVCLDMFNVNNMYRKAVVEMCDVLVDGPYIDEQRDITLKFKGSKNQRLIDVKETLKQNKITTIQN